MSEKDLTTSSEVKHMEPDDFIVIELDDRLEFGAVVIDDGSFDNTGCNATSCKQNAVSC